MELMEESELGMQTFRTMQEEYGLPIPEYSYQDPFLVLTFPRSYSSIKIISEDKAIKELNTAEVIGFNWIKIMGEISKIEYADHFGFDIKKAYRHLAKMKTLGLIDDNGEKINSPNYKYIYKQPR